MGSFFFFSPFNLDSDTAWPIFIMLHFLVDLLSPGTPPGKYWWWQKLVSFKLCCAITGDHLEKCIHSFIQRVYILHGLELLQCIDCRPYRHRSKHAKGQVILAVNWWSISMSTFFLIQKSTKCLWLLFFLDKSVALICRINGCALSRQQSRHSSAWHPFPLSSSGYIDFMKEGLC